MIVQLDVKIVLHGVFWTRGCIYATTITVSSESQQKNFLQTQKSLYGLKHDKKMVQDV